MANRVLLQWLRRQRSARDRVNTFLISITLRVAGAPFTRFRASSTNDRAIRGEVLGEISPIPKAYSTKLRMLPNSWMYGDQTARIHTRYPTSSPALRTHVRLPPLTAPFTTECFIVPNKQNCNGKNFTGPEDHDADDVDEQD